MQCQRDREICHTKHMYVKRDLQTGTKHVKGGLTKRPVYNGKRRIWSLICHKRLAFVKRHQPTRTSSMKRDLQKRPICNGKRRIQSLNYDFPFEAQKRKFCSTNISRTTMYAERILHNTRLYMKRDLQKRPICNGKRPCRIRHETKETSMCEMRHIQQRRRCDTERLVRNATAMTTPTTMRTPTIMKTSTIGRTPTIDVCLSNETYSRNVYMWNVTKETAIWCRETYGMCDNHENSNDHEKSNNRENSHNNENFNNHENSQQ